MNAGPFSPRANVPVGGAPAGLVSWCVVTTSPVGVLRKPAGTVAFHIAGMLAWWNVDGTPAGWVPLSTFAVVPTLAPLSTVVPELLSVAQELRVRYISRGRTFAGFPARIETIFDDFGLTDVNAMSFGGATSSGTAGRTRSTTDRTAWLWGTGANAGSTGYLEAFRGGAWLPTAPSAARWYLGWRMKVNTAVDAQTLLAAVIGDGAGHYIRAGVDGTASAVNFSVLSGATPLVTAVPVDGVAHTFELYRSTGDIHFLIDGIDRGTVAPPAIWGGHSELLPIQVYNGTTAANRAVAHYWYLALSEAEE